MHRVATTLVTVAAVLLAGCTAGGVSCNPDPNAYRCNFGGTGDLQRTDDWGLSSQQANVTVRMGGVGTLNVTLLDANGTVVYQRMFEVQGGESFTDTTDPGEPGTWTVKLQGSYTGGLDVRLTKVPT